MRDTEEEPASAVLARLRNNRPKPPNKIADPDYPRRVEAWERAIARETEREKLERAGKSPKEAGEHFARESSKKAAPMIVGKSAAGPEIDPVEEQKKLRAKQEVDGAEMAAEEESRIQSEKDKMTAAIKRKNRTQGKRRKKRASPIK